MNGCNGVTIMTMNGCNGVKSMTMNGCNGVTTMTMNGCNGVTIMTMNRCNGVRYDNGHYTHAVAQGYLRKSRGGRRKVRLYRLLGVGEMDCREIGK